MHSKNNNIEIMISDEEDEVIKELFELVISKLSNWVANISER